MEKEITTRDFVKMLEKPISANERPYIARARRYDNEFLVEFGKVVIDSRKGKLKIKDVLLYFEVYCEGKEYLGFKKLNLSLPRPSEKQLQDIIAFLKNADIEALKSAGIFCVNYCWDVLLKEIKLRTAEEKYTRVFSKHTDPNKWMDLVDQNAALFTGKEMLVQNINVDDLNTISEKIRACSEKMSA